jgi:hypothetical protein
MRAPLLSVLLGGCGLFSPDITGTWEGSCALDDRSEYRIDIELEDDAGEIDGEGTISTDYGGTRVRLEVVVDGDRDGRQIDLEMFAQEAGGQIVSLDVEADLERGVIDGGCSFLAVQGDLTLEPG